MRARVRVGFVPFALLLAAFSRPDVRDAVAARDGPQLAPLRGLLDVAVRVRGGDRAPAGLRRIAPFTSFGRLAPDELEALHRLLERVRTS
jgi:hypothetical protein